MPTVLTVLTRARQERTYPPLVPRQLARHPPYRRALVIVLVGFVMGSLFVISYIDALGRPTARRITTGVVGSSPHQQTFIDTLQKSVSKGLILRQYPTQASRRARDGPPAGVCDARL